MDLYKQHRKLNQIPGGFEISPGKFQKYVLDVPDDFPGDAAEAQRPDFDFCRNTATHCGP
jgi:hypothetical protein